jgi:hypothetical protein
LRAVLAETFGWRGRGVDILLLLVAVGLAVSGWRAVYAVTAAST